MRPDKYHGSRRPRLVPALGLFVAATLPASLYAEAPKPIDFAHDIVPLVKARCAECHTNGKHKGSLSMDTRQAILRAKVVVPGDSGASELVKRITSRDADQRMPPKGQRLTEREVALVRAWIDQGLPWQEGFTFAAGSYVPPLKPRRPSLPPAHEGRDHPIDRILDAYYSRHQLKPPAPLDDSAFTRRVYLDIIGQLPAAGELEAFVTDVAPDKRDRLIRRLLDERRAYAEHWLTFWNDLLRNDYQHRPDRPRPAIPYLPRLPMPTRHGLTAAVPVAPHCLSRRSFLRIGTLGFGGLTLPGLLRAEATAGIRSSHQSVILIYLVGGPPHQDLFDLKPNAPKEVAGPWKPIATNLTGVKICEALPRLARIMDKLVVVRSLVGNQADHDTIQVYNGHHPRKPTPGGGWPQLGSAVAKLQGPVDPSVPPFVSLCYTCTHGPYNEPGPGFLGPSMAPFRAMGQTREDMLLRGLSIDRLADRKTLLQRFDTLRRDADANGAVQAMDAFTQQAFGLLTSSRMADALDLSKEPARVIERYGTGNPKVFMDGNGAPRVPQSLLMARRLVEAGARVVTLNYSKWDWHGGKNAEGRADNSIFLREAEDFPIFDQCVSALVEDLHQRGLDPDCTVVILGEFGRTPKISAQVGRDHWPQVNCALLAGGGMKTGQVIGATDKIAGEAVARPVTWGELFATLYRNLGIDSHRVTLSDLSGRPQYLVEEDAKPLPELV